MNQSFFGRQDSNRASSATMPLTSWQSSQACNMSQADSLLARLDRLRVLAKEKNRARESRVSKQTSFSF